MCDNTLGGHKMNIKRLCLIAGLLCLLVANANARQISINVPVALTNVPVANTRVSVVCNVRDGSVAVGGASNTIVVPEGRSYSGIVVVTGLHPDRATHYTCNLSNVLGEPALAAANRVEGDIPQ